MFSFLISMLNAQWLNNETLKTTVLLEKFDGKDLIPHGTGFLFYNYNKTTDIIVVTCAHLIQNKEVLSVRLNPDSTLIKILSEAQKKGTIIQNALIEQNSIRFFVDLSKSPSFIHPTLDVAAFAFKMPLIIDKSDTLFKPLKLADISFIPKSIIKKRADLSLGDEVYFIGFPLGYGSLNNVEPIVRSGSIAWLPSDDNIYMLDAFSYGGNSGSPVFQKNLLGSKPGELKWSGTELVGMIVGHQSIKIENILNQPKKDELKFEITDIDINIGLARCIYTDDIIFVIDKLNEKIK
jgi:hypothetical protein